MRGRWLVHVLFWVTAGLVACGDNRIASRDGGGDDDAPIDAPADVPTDVPTDVPVDMPPDMMIDAACTTGTTPMVCSGDCTDVNIDPLNCGACGTTCDVSAGEMCNDGLCCGATESNCSGTCRNLQDDEANCGACGNACGNGESCISGVCRTDCTGGEMNCGAAPGTCVDTSDDNDNCGACGTTCDTGETCTNGQCVCDTPDTCGSTCTNVDTDPANCGACGNACAANQVCNNGVCVATCTGGTQNCDGSCVNVQSDPFNCGQCGTECDAGEVCSNGTCAATCASGTDCFGACVNTGTDEQNCGACGDACALGATCTNGSCACPAGTPTACDGTCVNTQIDQLNCGACGNFCTTGQMCSSGVCVTTCGGATPDRCGMMPGICTNFDTDENNCGSCGNQCGNGETCTNGVCLTDCPPSSGPAANDDRCGQAPGFCTDTGTDEDNCGSCGNDCAANRQCTGGTCQCFGATPNDCSGTCTNTNSDPQNCGGCGNACPAGLPLCQNGSCQPNCTNGTVNCNGSCVNLQTDELNCNGCGNACPSDATCTGGSCICDPALPDTCGTKCTDVDSDPDNCGACGTVCGLGESCSNGECCGPGTTGCGNSCVDMDTDPMNCGACGNVCGNGQVCNDGTCECGYGYSLCGGSCIPTSTDPDNCGGCGVQCPANQACVSNGCSATCPPPLTKCGDRCVNLNTDSDFCGSCTAGNRVCGNGQGCSDGACVAAVPVGPDPAKCVGGGPPIFVPTGGGDTCTGDLGSVSFTFAMCSRTDIMNLTQNLTTDAFNSAVGPYVPNQLGGGVGVNGFYENNKTTTIGGDLFIAGTGGFTPAGNTTIRQRMFVLHSFVVNKLLTVQENEPLVEEDTYIGGPISASGGQNSASVQDLVTSTCTGLPSSLIRTDCQANLAAVQAFFTNPPCGTAADLVPVGAIVDHFAIPANNDNALIGLNANALNNTGAQRLDLPCGYYHLNAIAGSAPITIVVHGRTALFISGNVDLSNEFYVDLEPGATLDVFIKGYLNTSQSMTLGNPNYPRLSRFYIQGTNTTGESLKLSGGATYLNGVFWAGYGTIRASNELEMYGAMFANSFHLQGEVKVHYDEGVVQNGEECPETSQDCDTCRDCNNQACVAGTCGACTSDAQCCSPLHCVNPGPQGRCEL